MTQSAKPLSPMRRRAVDQLLIEYLELPEREQSTWLEGARKRLPRLGRWLMQLIDDSHTVTLLNESVRRVASESADRIEISATRLENGDRLGPWEVIEEVGQGGMGRVYRGQRADGAFEMDVAIKQIGQRRRGLAELLQRECRLLAKLDHPSVTRLIDAGLDDRAGPFLVMEWVEGSDLADWLEQEEPDLKTRLRLFERIAEAVAHAHQRLIVHGDIKPNNIRIRADGSVKLMDFGVARLLDSGQSDQTGLRALTPAFAAPEQRAGEDITPSCDIWSMGSLLYWILTSNNIPPTPGEVTNKLAEIRLTRSDELAALINRAGARRIDERYASISELTAEIHRYRNDKPLQAHTLSRLKRSLKFIRRHRLGVSAASVVTFSLIAGIATSSWMYLRAENERKLTERSEQTARIVTELQQALLSDIAPDALSDSLLLGFREAIRAEGLPEEHLRTLNEIISIANPVDLLRQSLVSNVLEPSDNRLKQQLAGNAEAAAALHHSLAEVYYDWGLFSQSYDKHLQAWNLRRELLGPTHPETLASQRSLASAMNADDNTPSALELIRSTYDHASQALGPRHPETLAAGHVLGGTLFADARLDEAAEVLAHTLKNREQVLGPEDPETLNTAASLAVALARTGHLEAAGDLFERVFRTRLEVLGETDSRTLTSANNLAIFRFQTGDIEHALEMFSVTADMALRIWGQNHPSTLLYQFNRAQALHNRGRYDEALHLHSLVWETRARLLGPVHSNTLTSSAQVAEVLYQMERYDEALEQIVSSHQHMARTLGESHPQTLHAQQRIGRFKLATGALERGLEHLEQAHEKLQQVTHPASEFTLIALTQRIAALNKLGRYEQAQSLLASDPALPGPGDGPVLVHQWYQLYGHIAEFYDNWHQQAPTEGHDVEAADWRTRMAGLSSP
ncbi:MAG: tetratricopeptide repeat protein [Wenzhouxiangella sp.]